MVNFDMRILVVDDYATMQKIERNLLKQIGFGNVDTANDGSQALQMLRLQHYDLILSDWNMEPMTGLMLLREVRNDPALKHIPFIMVTAETKQENVIAAREAGVSNYIIKPFTADTLKKKLQSVIGDF
jgi:two-component system chemotaxis response regulator CheY